MTRLRVGAALLAITATAIAAPAQAGPPQFKRCGFFAVRCARVSVPLDRSGGSPAQVSLFVERLRAEKPPRRGALFVLAGGPGQSATYSFDGDSLGPLSAAVRHRDLIVFDQRGTGRSGALRCPRLEYSDLVDAGLSVGRCARRLGPARTHYTSRDSVDDIEALRVTLGYDKIALFGTSYGTKVALGYALTYPSHVERLVLDSVLPVNGPDPLYRPTLAAVPRVLHSLCRAGCASFTHDPVEDLSELLDRMRRSGLSGSLFDGQGRRHPATLTRIQLFELLVAGDFDARLRAAYPGAVKAALDGDAAPLLRLYRRAYPADRRRIPANVLSPALFAATICEEMPLPWARTAPPDPSERRRQAEAATALIPASAFLPFDRAALLDSDLMELCDRWPAAPVAPAFGPGPLPDVPVLLLEGEDDLRTPVEGAQRVATEFPRAKLVVAPATGHSALGGSCTGKAFVRFFRDRPVSTLCPAARRQVRPPPPPPTSLARVPEARGIAGGRGRVVTALALTLRDVEENSFAALLAGAGGLRGGHLRVSRRDVLRLFGVVFVPGVRVSGTVRRFGTGRERGRLVLRGPAGPDGVLELRGRRVSGRLGGREVRARLSLSAGGAALREARVLALPVPGSPSTWGKGASRKSAGTGCSRFRSWGC